MGAVSIETVFYVLEAIAFAGLVAAGFFIWKQFSKDKHQRHASKVVESLGIKFIRDLVLPDGIDGLIFIDYLLLVPDGFVVLNMQHSEGHLFGGKTVDQWSQVINNKTYKFDNPLYANQSACQAVLWNLQHNIESADTFANKHWKIEGWVVFSNAGNFPKGIPEQVSMIDDLRTSLAPMTNDNNPPDIDLAKAWDALHNLSITTQTANNR